MREPQYCFSGPTDVVVTSVAGRHDNLLVNLMSLRSTLFAGRVVVMHEEGHVFEDELMAEARAMRVELVAFAINWSFHTDVSRAEWMLAWLRPRVGEVSRVFYVDAFDAFYQGDPFEGISTREEMVFVGEGIQIRDQKGNVELIDQCFGAGVAQGLGEHELLCSGTVVGHVRAFVQWLELLIGDPGRWRVCRLDQPQINWLLWTGAATNAGLQWRVLGCDGPANSMYFCPRHRIEIGNGFFDVSANATRPVNAIIHHYLGWPSIVRNNYRRCKRSPPPMRRGVGVEWGPGASQTARSGG
jgi:hypothetical protein